MPSVSSGGIGSVRGSAQLGQMAKNRQKYIQKIREIDGFILMPQQFDKFSLQNAHMQQGRNWLPKTVASSNAVQ